MRFLCPVKSCAEKKKDDSKIKIQHEISKNKIADKANVQLGRDFDLESQ